MKYGEVVKYVRNGVALNALVLHSQQVDEGEHLIIAYADPQFSGNGISRAIATAFDVKPFVEGANQGWQRIDIDPEELRAAEFRQQVEKATALLTKS